MLANYHTHTYRCGHADMLPEERYIEQAIANGLQVLGFSDHTPWPFTSDTFASGTRMSMDMLPDYIDTIRNLQQQYHDQIHIYLGLECEYYPAYYPWLDSIRGELDYLILGNHWPLTDENGTKHFMHSTTPDALLPYFDCMIAAMETGWFSCMAHPEIGLASYPAFDNYCIDGAYRICRKAKELDLPIEYNLYGLEKADTSGFAGLGYPCSPFWEIAKEVGCKAIIGYDAHFLRHLKNPVYAERAERYLTDLGIELLQTLPGLE